MTELDVHRSEGAQHREIVLVDVAGLRIGIPADAVLEVQPAAAITPLPDAPRVIEGILDLRGEALAVISGRTRLGAGSRAARLSDRFVIVRTETHLVALRVDAAVAFDQVSVLDLDRALSLAPEALHDVGLARLDDGLVVIYDPDAFLSAEESTVLEAALLRRLSP